MLFFLTMSMPVEFEYFHISDCTEETAFRRRLLRSSCTLQPEATNVQDGRQLCAGRACWAVSTEETACHPHGILTSFSIKLSADALACN